MSVNRGYTCLTEGAGPLPYDMLKNFEDLFCLRNGLIQVEKVSDILGTVIHNAD